MGRYWKKIRKILRRLIFGGFWAISAGHRHVRIEDMSTGPLQFDSSKADSLVREIHDSGRRLVLAVTGGGSGAIGELLAVPGASRSVLEARVPYAASAMNDWLRAVPESYCSGRTARAMAMAAFQRADCLAHDAAREAEADAKACGEDLATLAGLGVTASLASDRPKRGAHRIHAAAQTAAATIQVSLTLEKDHRSRAEEERIATALVLNLVAESCGVPSRLKLPLTNSETIERRIATAPDAWKQLLTGQKDKVCAVGSEAAPAVVFPGAFNQRHSGHRQMAKVAERVLGHAIAHEISIENVDKPPLDFIEIEDRLSQFDDGEVVWLTRAAAFVQKAERFPGATFVVGADTLRRIAEPKYYEAMKMTTDEAIDALVAAGCRFLMFGRVEGEGADADFVTLEDLSLSPRLAAICSEVPESAFRDDISSTELRNQAATDEE